MCHFIACIGCHKKLSGFRASCDVRCLKLRHLRICLGFRHRTSQLARNPLNFFITAYTCDEMTPRQVSWISDFVSILYNLKILYTQVPRRVPWKRCAKFGICHWIRSHTTCNTMNMIFWITQFQYSMHLQFKFELPGRIQVNEINLLNIANKIKKAPNFNMYFKVQQ